MTDHEHDFGPPKFRVVRMCAAEGCTEMRIGTKRGGYRKLKPNEQTAVTIRQWEDLILVDAMTVIHGRERGVQRVREMRGYYETVL